LADAPQARQEQQDGEDEERRAEPRVDLVAPFARRGIGLGAEAGEPDEPQDAEGEEEEGGEGVVHWEMIVGGV